MADTIVARFQAEADRHHHHPLWHDFDGGTWRPTTWSQGRAWVEEIAAGLMSLGVEQGDRVGLVGVNSSDWVAADYGIQHAAAIPVPLYNTLAPDQIGYVLGHSGASVLILDSQEQLDKALAADIPDVAKIVAHHLGEADRGRVIGTEALRQRGRQWAADNVGALRQRMAQVQADDLFSLIYTSGTTGPPKGTMLTHRNAIWTADAAFRRLGVAGEEVFVSYLPLSHVFERLVTTLAPLAEAVDRIEYYFVPEITMVPEALKAARPTIFVGVPRVFEKFEARIRSEVAEAPAARQKLFHWATDAGIESVRRRDEGGGSPLSAIGAAVARSVVGKKVKGELGLDRCHFALSGAAPLAADVQRFFQGIGIPLHQGWGMTETTAGATAQAPDEMHVGSVGRPFDGSEIRIADDGEIMVKGPNIFSGYYGEEAKTKEVLSGDGWLATGDIGELRPDGSLRIVDRKKDIIITAGGKNVAPQEIEAMLKADGLISEAIVIGDRRPFLVSLLSLDADEAKAFLHAKGIAAEESEVYGHPAVLEHVGALIEKINGTVSRAESIRKWRVIDGGFPPDALTPTLKLKRRVVNEKFADAVETLYS